MESRKNEQPADTFLKSLYQHGEGGFINFRFLPKDPTKQLKEKFIPLSEIESIPKILKNYIEQYHCYFAVATRVNGDGSKDGIIQIPALWVDLDLYKLTDKEKEESRQRYREFPLKATFVIDSGGGRYLFWMFKEPAPKEEIPRVENLLKRLASYFYGDMAATDASRILRIPGSLNHKYQHTPRVIIKDFHPNEYNLDDLERILSQVKETSNGEEKPQYQENGERLKRIMECEFLKHCSSDRITLSEPAWYAMISILAREAGGRNLIHVLSRGYPKYSPQETDRKILHAINDAGPAMCERIKTLWDCGKDCEVTSPAVLALRAKQDELRNHPDSPLEKKENSQRISYRLTTLSDVFEYPEPTFVIDQILVEGTVSVLGAYTGVGKSITALSIIKPILTGDLLWEKYPVIKTGPVLLVDEETPKSFLRERIEKMGFDKTLPFYFLHFQDVRLDRDDCFNVLMTRIDEVKPVLVVIDSLIRVHRQKEDDATSMSKVVDRLRKIANWGTTVLVIHHHRKGEGPLSQKLRGSSDIPGGVDIEYALTPKDDYLVFSSVKTRTKPLAPIRLKMEADDEKIEVTYQGIEIGERGEILSEVVKILKGGEVGVKEIYKDLHDRGYVIGDRTLRDILRNAVGKELVERSGERGKRFYGINPALQFIPPIYTCKTAKVEGDDGPHLSKTPQKSENACQGQTLDNQCPDASLAVCKDTPCQGDKVGLYEVMDDGQLIY